MSKTTYCFKPLVKRYCSRLRVIYLRLLKASSPEPHGRALHEHTTGSLLQENNYGKDLQQLPCYNDENACMPITKGERHSRKKIH